MVTNEIYQKYVVGKVKEIFDTLVQKYKSNDLVNILKKEKQDDTLVTLIDDYSKNKFNEISNVYQEYIKKTYGKNKFNMEKLIEKNYNSINMKEKASKIISEKINETLKNAQKNN